MKWGPVKATALFCGSLAVLGAAPRAVAEQDYMYDKFDVERLLEWGERPVWSPDSKRIAFTADLQHVGPAYEIDLATRKVRCLTCRWGASGNVVRIYYLPDGSYLILGPAGLETAETSREVKPQPIPKTFLYWMPADLSLPPQQLGAGAFGEIAIDYDHSPPGMYRIAWGEFEERRMLKGSIVHDGKQAFLIDRTILYDKIPTDPASLVTYTETYDFIDKGNTILFFTAEKGRLYNGMYEIDLATGKMASMPTDGQHNEMHTFPDDRFGLEESNRGSDPSSPYRGVSAHRAKRLALFLRMAGKPENADALAEQYGGKPFDLYAVEWKTGKRRRLTNLGDYGGEAHQSSPARDGKQIVFSVRAPRSGPFADKPGIYVGRFSGR